MLYATGTSTDRKDNINVQNKDIVNTRDYLDDMTGSNQNNFNKNVNHDNNTENINLTSLGTGTQDLESLNVKNTSCLEKQIARTYKKDELVQAIIIAKVDGLQKLPSEILKKIKLSMGDFRMDRDKLYVKKRLYIPDNNELKICVLRQHHDSLEQGYSSYKIMFRSMQNRYFWPNMAKDCKRYAVNCGKTKAYNIQKQDLLNPLLIPNQK